MFATLIKCKDGEIIGIKTEQEEVEGCPTCDYGAMYTDYIEIATEDSNMEFFTYNFRRDSVYGFLSISEIIVFFCTNYNKYEDKTLNQFLDDFRQFIKES